MLNRQRRSSPLVASRHILKSILSMNDSVCFPPVPLQQPPTIWSAVSHSYSYLPDSFLAVNRDTLNRRPKRIAVEARDVSELRRVVAQTIPPDGNYPYPPPLATNYQAPSSLSTNERKISLTLAVGVLVVELQAGLATVGDGVASGVKVTRASDVADGAGAARARVAVD